MSDREDGGQVFPSVTPVMRSHPEVQGALEKIGDKFNPGMSHRDYFAAHAPDVPDGWWKGDYTRHDNDVQRLVQWKYHYADKMIKERNRP